LKRSQRFSHFIEWIEMAEKHRQAMLWVLQSMRRVAGAPDEANSRMKLNGSALKTHFAATGCYEPEVVVG
jgi:hypothetical protein